MLKPGNFKPNDAWILFRLNDAPIVTEPDGDFDILCLMDAASCYILGNEFVPAQTEAVTAHAVRSLLASARSVTNALPDTVFVSSELPASEFAQIIAEIGAEMVVATKRELSPIVSETKRGFRAHMKGRGLS